MKLVIAGCLAMLLVGCSNTPRYNSYSYSSPYVAPTKPTYTTQTYKAPVKNTYVSNNSNANTYNQQKSTQRMAAAVGTSTAPQTPVTAPMFERLSYEDLVRFEPDCEKGTEQVALLEEQLRRGRFYTVDGVEGNTYPGKISKSYHSLAKYRIWSLRFACQGSEVSRDFIKADLQASPNLPPTSIPRCYFEETTEAKTGFQQTNYLASDHRSSRKEICTNFPYVDEKPFIRVGDQMSMSPRQLVSGVSNSALRKWRGNVYQLVSKTEMHLNQAVRFTLVTVRSGVNQWTVVDKF
ncbi:hypothetical protein [Polynucleobacter bastaniensis]|uniref:hypothetical protein n=1 Tax=Polynucleobacter bastaniensis TaxID=2081039 RepID=UPI001C0CEC1C|nr:hypothetical protein [Polynucleobacter bastaniensis]MBU3598554.1 hypothetical protein [Polynucleobacter bastaniensis]